MGTSLQDQNRILRGMVLNLSECLTEIIKALPPELQQGPANKAIITMHRIRRLLEKLEEEARKDAAGQGEQPT